MDINQMRYYIEVCDSGSMSKAAEKLHMSQQGLSIAIRRLENELNCDLFYRKSSGLVLTDVGKKFKVEAEEIIKHVNHIYDFCAASSSGRIRVAVAITQSLIVRLPMQLQQILINGTDEFDVKLYEGYSKNCSDMVYENEARFGLIYGDCDLSKFEITTLDMVKQVFIVNRSHPLAKKDAIELRDLDSVPLVLPDEFSWPRIEVSRMFEKEGVKLNVAYECNRPRQVIDLVSNNPKLAARTIADEVTEKDLEKIKVLLLKDNPFLLPVRLISKKGCKLSVHERLFRHIIIDCYQ